MSALSKLVMTAMMWGAGILGAVMIGLCAVIFQAMRTGGEGGMSAGQNPQAGLLVMAVLAVICFGLAFVVRRELKKHDPA